MIILNVLRKWVNIILSLIHFYLEIVHCVQQFITLGGGGEVGCVQETHKNAVPEPFIAGRVPVTDYYSNVLSTYERVQAPVFFFI